MNQYRLKALEGLLDYLSGSQGGDLKALMDEPEQIDCAKDEGVGGGVGMEAPKLPEEELSSPLPPEELESKMAIPGGKESMREEEESATDDELEELYNKFRK